MPSYNAGRFIEQAIQSVLTQSFKNFELIVVDDASTDHTAGLLKSLAASDPRIRVIVNKTNLGVAASRNRAIACASGQFVAFLDADDIWLKDKLDRQLRFMQKKNAEFCFTAHELCDEHGVPSGKAVDLVCPDKVGFRDLALKRATIGSSTVMIDRTNISKLEVPPLRIGEDYALWLILLKANRVAHRLPEALTRYRVVPGSLSRNKFRQAAQRWQTYRKYAEFTFFQSTWYFLNYAYKSLLPEETSTNIFQTELDSESNGSKRKHD